MSKVPATKAKPSAKAASPAAKAAAKVPVKAAAKKAAAPSKAAAPAKKAAVKAAAPAKAPVKAPPAQKAPVKPASKAAAPAAKPAAQAAPAAPAKKAAPAPKASAAPAKPAAAPASVPTAKAAALASSKLSAAAGKSGANTPPQTAVPLSSFAARFSPARQAIQPPIVPAKPAFKPNPKLANAWKTKPGRDLSEEELLSMPESEYMNEAQLDFFRARLIEQRDEVLSNAGETTEHLREDTSIVPDPADRATIEEEHALELRTRDRERKLLKKIMQAISLIDSGDYGYCDETGEPIGLGRLLARPTATLSLEAQQRRELKQKMFGD